MFFMYIVKLVIASFCYIYYFLVWINKDRLNLNALKLTPKLLCNRRNRTFKAVQPLPATFGGADYTDVGARYVDPNCIVLYCIPWHIPTPTTLQKKEIK